MNTEPPSAKRRPHSPTKKDRAEENDVHQVAEGVYAAQIVTNKGETIYFGMELLDESSQTNWIRYKDHTDYLTKRNRGILTAYAQPEENYINYQEVTGYTDEEFAIYISKFKQTKQKNKNLLECIEGIGSGVVGFSPFADGKRYVAYISTTPITGKRDFSQQPNDRFITLKMYNEIYKGLIMSVGVDGGEALGYQNRGIFRNPDSFINGGHEHISLILHACTAAVMFKFFGRKYFVVSPVKAMHTLLAKEMPKDQMLTQSPNKNYGFGRLPEKIDTKALLSDPSIGQIVEEAFNHPSYGNGALLQPGEKYGIEFLHVIKIEALLELYKEALGKRA